MNSNNPIVVFMRFLMGTALCYGAIYCFSVKEYGLGLFSAFLAIMWLEPYLKEGRLNSSLKDNEIDEEEPK